MRATIAGIAGTEKSAQSLVDGATVTRDAKDAGHLIVTTSATKAYSELKRLVTAVSGDNETFADAFGKPPKDRPIVLDLRLDGGRLTAAEINVLQFVDGATGRVAVRLELGYEAVSLADEDGSEPADHLAEVVGPGPGAPFRARIVRRGVAEVTVAGEKACPTVPASAGGSPKVTKGAC